MSLHLRNEIRKLGALVQRTAWTNASVFPRRLAPQQTVTSGSILKCNTTPSSLLVISVSTRFSSSSRADAANEMKSALNALDMAVDGCNWLDASAEVAYLEREVTERPPRAHFTEHAARNAQQVLKASIKHTESALKRLPHAPLELKRDASEAVINARMCLARLENDRNL